MKVGIDVSPLVLDARRHRALRRAACSAGVGPERRPSVSRLAWGGSGAADAVVRDVAWYPLGLAAARARRSTSCTARRSARRCAAPVPVVVTVHDLAVLRHPELFNRWTRAYSRTVLLPRAARGRGGVIAVSEFTKREVVELSGVPEDRVAWSYRTRADDASSARRAAAPTASTCSRSGRSSRARTCRGSVEATGALGVELRVVGRAGLGRRRGRRTACAGSAASGDDELARAATAARSASPIRRSTRASASRCSRRCAAARRSSRARGGAMEEVAGGAAVLVDPLDAGVDRGGDRARRSAGATSCARPGSSARGASAGTRPRGDGRRLPEGGGVMRRSSRRRRRARPASAPATRPTSRTCCARCPAGRHGGLRLAARHAPPGARPGRASSRSSCRRGSQELRMAWRCRALLRRLRPALAHFQHALPLALPVPGGASPCTTCRSSATATADGPRTTGSSSAPSSRARCGAPRACSPSPSGRSATSSSSTASRRRRSSSRRTASTRRSRPARRRRRRLPPLRRRDPGAEGPARRRRGRRGGRAAARRRRAGEGAGARATSCGARGADLRGYVEQRRARRALPRRGRARAPVALRGLRAAGARGDGERDAGRRRAATPALREVAGDAAVFAEPARARRRASRRALDERERLVAAGLERARRFSLGRDRPAHRSTVYREVLGVRVSAVVVSHGHAAELERLAARRSRRRSTSWSWSRTCPAAAGALPRRRARARERAAARLRRQRERRHRGDDAASSSLRREPGRGARAGAVATARATSWTRTRAAGVAGPADALSGRHAGSPRAGASRRSRGTLVRRTPLRAALPAVRAQRGTTTSTSGPTEPVQADWMLGALPAAAARDARRARRLRRGLPPLRRGHRPLLPRGAGRLGALVRARPRSSTPRVRGRSSTGGFSTRRNALAPAGDAPLRAQAPGAA